MEAFLARPRHWGSSMGITFPKDVVQRGQIDGSKDILILLPPTRGPTFDEVFGSLKAKRSTKEMLEEIDSEDLDDEEAKALRMKP